MDIVKNIDDVKRYVKLAKENNKKIGLVPTMGALHSGHLSLIAEAKKYCDFVIVSVFVNPSQFGEGEDFDKYPRTLDEDAEKCLDAGVDMIFAPSAGEMYPEGYSSWINLDGITSLLEGAFRPIHFRGVTTVCGKLFNISCADYAFFGQKDYQQVAVIKKMVRELNMPIEIIICPIIRDTDGLALSSRNIYLTESARCRALYINKALFTAKNLVNNPKNSCDDILKFVCSEIAKGNPDRVDYIKIVDRDTLKETQHLKNAVILVAAVYDSVRLIDNMLI